MTPAAGRTGARFVADDAHQGTTETAWNASTKLAALSELDLPGVDRVVVVAPHPDDEVLGAGGLIQVLAAQGVRVEICAVTDGEAFTGPVSKVEDGRLARLRTAEAGAALGKLGLGAWARTRLGLPDGDVAGHQDMVSSYLSSHLDSSMLCLAPWRGDGHPDHDATGRAAAEAVAQTGAMFLEYLVWAWHWADPEGDDLPWYRARRLTLDAPVVAAKRSAVTAFVSQTEPFEPGGSAILPPAVLRRFWRPYEIYLANAT